MADEFDLLVPGYQYKDVRAAIEENNRRIKDRFSRVDSDFQSVIEEVSSAAFEQVVDAAKLEWLPPVNSFSNLTSTYPDATEGKTAMTRDSGKVYRFNGTSWIEVQDIDPTVINEIDTRLSTQLSVTTTRALSIPQFGNIQFPPEFTRVLPFNLFRKGDWKIYHDMLFENLYRGAPVVYVHYRDGLTTNDGLTPSTPVRRLPQALTIANGLAGNTAVIQLMTDEFPYTELDNTFTYSLSKKIVIRGTGGKKVVLHSGRHNTIYTWTQDGNAYSTTRSAVSKVFDITQRDFLGSPKEFKNVGSVAEVQNTRGSWYSNGTTVWIRKFDDTAPDLNLVLLLPLAQQIQINAQNQMLFLDGIEFLFDSSNGSALLVAGNANTEFYTKDCIFAYGQINGVRTNSVGAVYHFNSKAYENGSDGFNYHGQFGLNPYEFAFEYGIYSYNNGAIIGSTGNATTAHEGMTILRVGSVGFACYGPVLADVNGCLSINYDCIMVDSLRPAGNTKSGFYFDEASAVKEGKAYLFNCSGGGKDTFTVNSDGQVEIVAQGLKGDNVPVNNNIVYV